MANGTTLDCAKRRRPKTGHDALLVVFSKEGRGIMASEYVYVLSKKSVNHGGYDDDDNRVVGVYASKAAAVEAAGDVHTSLGTFESAMSDLCENDHEDNRENPPDNGFLLQLGSSETGEGDYIRLDINKFPILGSAGNTAKSNAAKKRKK